MFLVRQLMVKQLIFLENSIYFHFKTNDDLLLIFKT